MASNELSIVEYLYDSGTIKHACGYCEKKSSYKRDGMWAESLTVDNYQSLIDRGWRRSGRYCYIPRNIETCCPMYTIRCNALDFVVSKSQKIIIKRMTKFLKDGERMIEEESRTKKKSDKDELHGIGACSNAELPEEEFAEYSARAHKNILQNEPMMLATNCEKRLSQCPEDVIKSKIKRESSQDHDSPPSHPMVPSKLSQPTEIPPNRDGMPRKKKLMRIERARSRLLAQGKTLEEIEDFYRKKKMPTGAKSIEELLSTVEDGQNKLEIKLIRVSSEEFYNTFDESFKLFKKYQEAVHHDKPEDQTKKSFSNFLGPSRLIHRSVRRGPPMGYGPFHQQYRLNGKLIAVGVIDILPYCVSSVYLFYDPEYSFLSLGTFSSLIEVRLVRELYKSASDLKYYYMGYYIHEIPKMRYKAKMTPSFLLCPETYTWHPIAKCTPKLDRQKYSRLNEDVYALDEDGEMSAEDIRQVRVLYRGESLKLYGEVQKIRHLKGERDDVEKVKLYAKLVGKTCAKSMSLILT
ncbi:arginyl-tRNA--protein transferase 1 isoform X2 [Fopius arisanus]|uniref:Arginyl-tRNA--protein transferase 1 n=1 Tax=Fopius arisanus TaxID=64838 RepID=A0A9R1T5V4_9HYME|nr:PREDICTED: arginyl-tRNA--protein transferase 1 isoform X2 [Fopius arisanus]